MEARYRPGVTTPRPSYDDPDTYARLAGFGGDWRDTWWNSDYLDLIGQRLDLGRRARLLDVGCGAGHWGRAVLRRMSANATLTGIDREPAFFDAAENSARAAKQTANYLEAQAGALPLEDDSFDVVTCQTVLIHVPDAQAVVAEMLRVTKPDGVVLLAEPDNLVMATSFMGTSVPLTAAERASLLRLQLLCHEGKRVLGEGDGDVGARLPALLREGGALAVQTFASDKCAWAQAPYDDHAQAVDIKTQLDFARMDQWMPTGPREDTRRHYLAGGGTDAEFDVCWAVVLRWLRTFERQVSAGTFHCARPTCMVLACGQPGSGA